MITLINKKFGRWLVLSRAANGKCNETRWNCICECGIQKTVCGLSLKNGKSKSCGCLCKELHSLMCKKRIGSKGPNWKGGRYKNLNGYILLHNPAHLNSNKNGYVLEHILVYSNYLGRPLTKDETVHHKNGDRSDNRFENLELWNSKHPSGQRVKDKIEFCQDFLKQYGDLYENKVN